MTVSIKCTEFEENYSQHYAAHGKPSAAYRASYPCEHWQAQSIAAEAYKVLHRPHVALRIHELRMEAAKGYFVEVAEKKAWLRSIIELSVQRKTLDTGKIIPCGDLAVAIKAINELNKMEGDHAATKTDLSVVIDELTPWSGVAASVDKMDK